MTLITNYFDSEKIIIASDKRSTDINYAEKDMVAQDNAIKLLYSSNYVVGVNGIVKSKKYNFLEIINQLVIQNENIHPKEFIEKFKKEIVPLVEEGKELNITVSGVYESKLISLYYQVQEDILRDCIKEDLKNIRFNGDNNNIEKYFRLGTSYIREKLIELGLIDKIGYSKPNLLKFKTDIIIDALKWMYHKFHENDQQYANIGGKMDYYIIHKDGRIEEFLNM